MPKKTRFILYSPWPNLKFQEVAIVVLKILKTVIFVKASQTIFNSIIILEGSKVEFMIYNMYYSNQKVVTCVWHVPSSWQLKGFEIIKAVHLDPIPFDMERGLLTPTFKKKRAQFLKYYQVWINE